MPEDQRLVKPAAARVRLAEALAHIPRFDGARFAELFQHGTLSVEIYAPQGEDAQQAHTRDEAYVVVQGNGTFYNGSERHPFTAGDFLFVPAGTAHRFEDFSDDLAVWVIFFGPEGGESGQTHRAGRATKQ